jgi:phosphatidylserine decarboxylase
MQDSTFMQLMRVLPKSALSTVVGHLTRVKAPASMHHAAIRWFARRYDVQLDEAERPVEGYRTFGDFFTRRLKEGARPIEPGDKVITSPVDGRVSQAGYAEKGELIQAKGVNYPVEKLLGDTKAAEPFLGGAFATLYLSPRDYHRIHAPLKGEIEGYAYIPGEFWPVNPASVSLKASLFAVNERLVTYMRTVAGRMAVVKVGATNVSRIRAAYDDIVTHNNKPGVVHSYPKPIPVEKGGELGVFEMGSTVILLFETGRIKWEAALIPDAPVRLGQRIGVIV